MFTLKNVYVIMCIIIKVVLVYRNILTTFLDINFHLQPSILDTRGIEGVVYICIGPSLTINYNYSEVLK